jgi:hypothetical protein
LDERRLKPTVVGAVKSRKLGTKNAHKLLVGKSFGKCPLGRPINKYED